MVNKILMPSGGQTTDEMVILKWNKKVGDPVQRGEELFDIETDKAILSVESYAEGILLDIRYQEGQLVKVGEIVAYIGEKDDPLPSSAPVAAGRPAADPQPAPSLKDPSSLRHQTDEEINEDPFSPSSPEQRLLPAGKTMGDWDTGGAGQRLMATPLARRLAKTGQVDLRKLADNLGNKVVKKADVEQYLEQRRTPRPADPDEAGSYLVEASQMRKTIGRRMRESLSTAPHYVVSVDVDMTNVISLRSQYNNALPPAAVKVSYNDIIMKATARAIADFPMINSTWEEAGIRVFTDVHVGLAVAVASGIVVPVVKNVNRKSLTEIARENAAHIEKARNNLLGELPLSGGTITLSNLGRYGVKQFTSIINQPESCILAVGSILRVPVAVGESVAVRDIMNITASFDHRVIDGATGAAFLERLTYFLESPAMILF